MAVARGLWEQAVRWLVNVRGRDMSAKRLLSAASRIRAQVVVDTVSLQCVIGSRQACREEFAQNTGWFHLFCRGGSRWTGCGDPLLGEHVGHPISSQRTARSVLVGRNHTHQSRKYFEIDRSRQSAVHTAEVEDTHAPSDVARSVESRAPLFAGARQSPGRRRDGASTIHSASLPVYNRLRTSTLAASAHFVSRPRVILYFALRMHGTRYNHTTHQLIVPNCLDLGMCTAQEVVFEQVTLVSGRGDRDMCAHCVSGVCAGQPLNVFLRALLPPSFFFDLRDLSLFPLSFVWTRNEGALDGFTAKTPQLSAVGENYQDRLCHNWNFKIQFGTSHKFCTELVKFSLATCCQSNKKCADAKQRHYHWPLQKGFPSQCPLCQPSTPLAATTLQN